MKNSILIILSLHLHLAAVSLLQAEVRRSDDRRIVLHNEGLGSGSTSSGGTATVHSKIGSYGGVASNGTLKLDTGYIGTLFEVQSLAIGTDAPSDEVGEGDAISFTAVATFADGSTANLDQTKMVWQAAAPLGDLPADASGGSLTTTAGVVLIDTPVDVTGSFFLSDTLPVTVLNSNPDNATGYAGDGIDDAWQDLYGVPTSSFVAAADDDGDSIELILEAFQNLNPNAAESFVGLNPEEGHYMGPPTAIIVEEGGNQYAAILFRKARNTSLPFAAKKSPDLSAGSFSTSGLVEAANSPIAIPGDPSTELRVFRSTTPLLSAGVEFLQLEVNEVSP